jgi:ribosomal protein S21
MTICAKRRENETVEKLISRFKKQTQGTRLVQLVRDQRYFKKQPTKRLIRVSALMRSQNRAKRQLEIATN